jgi:hypothetical protein
MSLSINILVSDYIGIKGINEPFTQEISLTSYEIADHIYIA